MYGNSAPFGLIVTLPKQVTKARCDLIHKARFNRREVAQCAAERLTFELGVAVFVTEDRPAVKPEARASEAADIANGCLP